MSASSCSMVCLLNFLAEAGPGLPIILSILWSSRLRVARLAMSTSMTQLSWRLGVPRPRHINFSIIHFRLLISTCWRSSTSAASRGLEQPGICLHLHRVLHDSLCILYLQGCHRLQVSPRSSWLPRLRDSLNSFPAPAESKQRESRGRGRRSESREWRHARLTQTRRDKTFCVTWQSFKSRKFQTFKKSGEILLFLKKLIVSTLTYSMSCRVAVSHSYLQLFLQHSLKPSDTSSCRNGRCKTYSRADRVLSHWPKIIQVFRYIA